MSTQIAVRLPDDMVRLLDQAVASGQAQNRTALVTHAIEREIRRMAAMRDAARLREIGPEDDLDGLVEWNVEHAEVGEG